MIKVERESVEVPEVYSSGMVEKANMELLDSHRRQEKGSQEHFRFRNQIWSKTKTQLKKLFHNKCAYCETSLENTYQDVDQFRPKSVYWWLAYEWENLYLSCQICNQQYKSNHFPILGSQAKPRETGSKLTKEGPLLLDPCIDDPEIWLRFDDKGVAYAAVPEDDDEAAKSEDFNRGEVSIDILGLNREELARSRKKEIKLAKSMLEIIAEEKISDEFLKVTTKRLTEMTQPSARYTAAVQQFVAREMNNMRTETEELNARVSAILELTPLPADYLDSEITKREMVEAKPLPDKMKDLQPSYIKSISLTNFKCFKTLKLKVDPMQETPGSLHEDLDEIIKSAVPEDEGLAEMSSNDDVDAARAGWLAFLGENAAGKSTVLEAIALALAPDTWRNTLSPKRFIRYGCRVAWIRLELARSDIPVIELRITPKGFEYRTGSSPSNTLIRGYGRVRLLATDEEQGAEVNARDLVRLDNLFNPRAPLCNVEKWLLELSALDKECFRIVTTTIKDVLPTDDLDGEANDLKPTEDGTGIEISMQGTDFSLQDLSAGYQSVISLAADIMSGIPNDRIRDLRSVPGTVFLDEIGTQLHPRWRMRVVKDLRKAFPMMQFIVSTHEPLCLRGLEAPELRLLRREEPKLTVFDDEAPNPAEMRIDQILTSRFFGMGSTIDPDLEKAFDFYYFLLTKPNKDPNETEACEKLRRKLWGYGVLGFTRRDQIVYELIDEWLANKDFQTSEDQRSKIEDISTEVRDQVFKMWEYSGLQDANEQT